ncbi:MAG: UbiA family prenyltransferase, partial [Candidatus Micrarchaeota archaeon]
DRFPQLSLVIILSLLVPIFSEMGSFALNDYLDIEADRANRMMERPLVKGTITPGFAFGFSVSCLAVSIIVAFFINLPAFVIALIFNLLGIAYNYRLKDLPLVGNAYIGLTMAIPFIFGNYVVSETLSPIALVLAVLGFVAGLAREIIKSVEDMEGDLKARGSKTLPIMIGREKAKWIAIVLYLLFIPLTALPFVLGLGFSVLAGALIGIADLLILAICFKTMKDGFQFARNVSLVAFLLGMAGIMAAL